MSSKVKIANIFYDSKDEEIFAHLRMAGPIIESQSNIKREQGSRKVTGIFTYTDHYGALNAVRNFNKKPFRGRDLQVKLDDRDVGGSQGHEDNDPTSSKPFQLGQQQDGSLQLQNEDSQNQQQLVPDLNTRLQQLTYQEKAILMQELRTMSEKNKEEIIEFLARKPKLTQTLLALQTELGINKHATVNGNINNIQAMINPSSQLIQQPPLQLNSIGKQSELLPPQMVLVQQQQQQLQQQKPNILISTINNNQHTIPGSNNTFQFQYPNNNNNIISPNIKVNTQNIANVTLNPVNPNNIPNPPQYSGQNSGSNINSIINIPSQIPSQIPTYYNQMNSNQSSHIPPNVQQQQPLLIQQPPQQQQQNMYQVTPYQAQMQQYPQASSNYITSPQQQQQQYQQQQPPQIQQYPTPQSQISSYPGQPNFPNNINQNSQFQLQQLQQQVPIPPTGVQMQQNFNYNNQNQQFNNQNPIPNLLQAQNRIGRDQRMMEQQQQQSQQQVHQQQQQQVPQQQQTPIINPALNPYPGFMGQGNQHMFIQPPPINFNQN